MKTPNLPLSAIMILPAALLLSQCAPIDGSLSQNPAAAPTPALHRLPVSSHSTMLFLQDTSGDEPRFACSNQNLLPIADDEDVSGDTDEAPAFRLAPLIVTRDFYSTGVIHATLAIKDWPTCAADADLRNAWIPFKQPDPPVRFPMGESGEAYLKSHR